MIGLNTRHRESKAGFWLRAWAGLIDQAFLITGSVLVYTVLVVLQGQAALTQSGPLASAVTLASVLGQGLYFVGLESSCRQATVGKMVLSLRVTDLAGDRLSFGAACRRHFGRILSVALLGYGYLRIGLDPQRRALHDELSASTVTKLG